MKTFIVLGMHRSHTSLIAKGLHESGVHMGDCLLGAHPSNPYGHFEDIDFISLNDKILSTAGGSWCNPPLEYKIFEAAKKFGIQEFIKWKERAPLWGWKDPRTVLTIQCYLPYLVNPQFISCYRKPIDVAQSLLKRDGMPIDKGVDLALIYNERLRKFLNNWIIDGIDIATDSPSRTGEIVREVHN